jgi:hypothetical protein
VQLLCSLNGVRTERRVLHEQIGLEL